MSGCPTISNLLVDVIRLKKSKSQKGDPSDRDCDRGWIGIY
jgi:hypothetical protein